MDNSAQSTHKQHTTPNGTAPGHTTAELSHWYWQQRGWCVLPAHYPLRDSAVLNAVAVRCTCPAGAACACIGKHPMGAWRSAEHDADTLARWRWADPQANIALLTGRRSGVAVGDVDPRHGGRLETLWERGWRHDTVIARSGGGGWHVYAACPPDGLPSVAGYAPGIEFRADGNLVIAPPSLHRRQHPTNPLLLRRYVWLPGHAPWECAVAPLPAAVLAEVRASRPQRSAPAAPAEPVVLTAAQRRELARRAPGYVARAVARVRAGRDGGRHNTGVWMACQLRDLRVADEVGRWAMLAYQQALEARHG